MDIQSGHKAYQVNAGPCTHAALISCIQFGQTPSLRRVRTIFEPVSIHQDLAGY